MAGSGRATGPRWQVVAGFRRMAAVRMLARERVLARLHAELSDGDAWGVALTQALLHEPLGRGRPRRAARAARRERGRALGGGARRGRAGAGAPAAGAAGEVPRVPAALATDSTPARDPDPDPDLDPDPLPTDPGRDRSLVRA